MRLVMVPGWQAKVRGPMLHLQRRMAGEITEDVRADILANHYVTGDLYGSVRQDGTRVYIGTDHWYFIEYGTRAHEITPSTKQALHWRGARHPVKRVWHPGTREYAPMRRALRKKRG